MPQTEKPCAFCNQEIIDKQVVITGKEVNVLLSHSPVGFGADERLHFLIVTKKPIEKFSELPEKAYLEGMKITQALNNHLSKTRKIENVYLFHKTGKDAGQIVPHWTLHLIFTANKVQNFWGKLIVAKNILFGGSSPLKDDKLKELVEVYRTEFAPIQREITN